MLELVIQRLKEISRSISSEQVRLLQNSSLYPNLDRLLQSLENELSRDVKDVLSEAGIANPENFFYQNGKVFFCGYDSTSTGQMLYQMFLYDIAEKRTIFQNILGHSVEYDWIIAGNRKFHGVLDILQEAKTGALSLNGRKVVYFDEDRKVARDIIEMKQKAGRGEISHKGITKMLLKHWSEDGTAIDIAEVATMIETSLMKHEGAHQLFDQVFFSDYNMADDEKIRAIFQHESEKFAILSQIAYGPIPSHTLANFLLAGQTRKDYRDAILSIVNDMINIVGANQKEFPNAATKLKPDGIFKFDDWVGLIIELNEDQMKAIAGFACEKLYKPLLLLREECLSWGIDSENDNFVFIDKHYKKINRPHVDLSIEKIHL